MLNCNQCGSCCRNARCFILPIEIYKICIKFKLKIKEFLEKYIGIHFFLLDDLLYILPKVKDNQCIFLYNNLCLIYECKPKNAKDYLCYDNKPSTSSKIVNFCNKKANKQLILKFLVKVNEIIL